MIVHILMMVIIMIILLMIIMITMLIRMLINTNTKGTWSTTSPTWSSWMAPPGRSPTAGSTRCWAISCVWANKQQ